ncbi:MAG TPA: GNAT family protein [Chloroflexaceae bacterium]|nr:GNAT family protein [Chloroflexaceae bacterium]
MDDSPMTLLAATLETERLLLRPIGREDLAFAVRHFTDPAVHRFMLDDEPITTAERAAEIVRFYVDTPGATYNRWVLARKADGEPLGTCGYHRWSRQHRKAEIGYDLSPAWQGQGYMREAVGAVLRHGFEALGLHRVEALVAVANERSAHLLRSLGFAREGLLRENFFSGGRFPYHELYAPLRKA